MEISKPMPEKGRIGVMTNTVKHNATCDGTVKGTEPFAYLGHFRSADVMKRGHNQGAPGLPMGPMRGPSPNIGAGNGVPALGGAMGGTPAAVPAMGPAKIKPQFDATTNPIAATRQAKRAVVQSARASGMPGAVKEARAMGRTAMAGAREQRQTRNAEGLRAGDVAALKSAKQGARAENKSIAQGAQAAKKDVVGEAKTALQNAVGGLHAARQATRAAVRGGNYAAQGNAVTARSAARSAVKTARKGLRAARK
jgi:hypothetical protein